jgi:O-succinylbenzoic acid--CoA ligase
VIDRLAASAASRPDAPAIIFADRVVTFRELDRAANGVAATIAASGSFGAHAVAVWGERTPEAVAALWGIPRAGVDAVVVDPRMQPAAAMASTRSAGVRGLWSPPDGGFDRLLQRGSDEPPTDRAGRYVVFTSGSEGERKGVILTQTNVAASVDASRSFLGNTSDDAWLLVLPTFHVGGLAILWRQADASAPVVLHERFDPAAAADALEACRFVSFVPVMLRRVLEVDDRRYDSEPVVLVGGAAASPTLIAAARARGIRAVASCGMTETCSQVCTVSPGEEPDGSVGFPLPGAEVRVFDGHQTVVGTPGRIEVRGPMLSPGYVAEPERAAGEWFTTSDLGVRGDDGRLVVLGRADHVIVTGGENVHPFEVQRVLEAHDRIVAAAVRGEPDEEWGERVVAVVETTLTIAELEEWAGERLPPHQRPRRWEIVDRIGGKLEDA